MDLIVVFENSEDVTKRGKSGNKSNKAKGKRAIPGYAIAMLLVKVRFLPGTNPCCCIRYIVQIDGMNGNQTECNCGMRLSVYDKDGNLYENCVVYKSSIPSSNPHKDQYLLNNEYSTFSGTIFVPLDRSVKMDDWIKNYAYFTIYGDDNVVLYRSPQMFSTVGAVEFSVDVSDVKLLTINWQFDSVEYWGNIGVDAYLYK